MTGQDGKWNISALPFAQEDWDRIALDDNYVGITNHHYYLDNRTGNSSTPNTNWQMTIDWVQLIIDGGSRKKAELTSANLKVENGKITADTSFLTKLDGNYSIEVSVIEKVVENGVVIERNLGMAKNLFTSVVDKEREWNDFTISNSIINPSKEYIVNFILSEDRGGGVSGENYTNPGEVQHLVSISTHDPIVEDINKSGYRNIPTNFTSDDFKSKYFKSNGHTFNGANLQSVQILSLPDSQKGKLVLEGADVAINDTILTEDLNRLKFIPELDGFDGTVEFLWNGYNGTKFAEVPATVTLNSSPKVSDFTKYMRLGEQSINFIGEDGFLDHYIDPGNELAEMIHIITLPDPAKGILRFNGSPIPANAKVNYAELSYLTYHPNGGVKGSASFTWNAYDGIQYAQDDATATIIVSEAPVVDNLSIIAELGQPISFATEQFTNAPYYTDNDNDALSHATINIPSNFSQKGSLSAQLEGAETSLQPGQSYELTPSELSTLKFTPVASLVEGTSVIIPWTANDGIHNSKNSANITITYYTKPEADNKVIIVDEDTTSIEITTSGSYKGSSDDITFGHIVKEPVKGSITKDSSETEMNVTYTTDTKFKLGTDEFTYTVEDKRGVESMPATVTIHIQKKLNGWVGNKAELDSTVINPIPGEILKLSARSSIYATKVIALVNDEQVELTLDNPGTYGEDGYKKWVNNSYFLPKTVIAGDYTPTFKAFSGDPNYIQNETNLIDNQMRVLAPVVTITNPNNSSLSVEKGTKVGSIPFPTTVDITLSDGTKLPAVSVIWDKNSGRYQQDKAGTYTFTGKLQNLPNHVQNVPVTISVQVLPSKNVRLKSIHLNGSILPNFDGKTLDYTVSVPYETRSANLTTETVDADTQVSITGGNPQNLQVGDNVVEIVVTAENGDSSTYKITIKRTANSITKPDPIPPPVDNGGTSTDSNTDSNLETKPETKPIEPTPEQPTPPEVPKEEPKPKITFNDIFGHWAKAMIENIAARGIINGYPDGSFRPNDPITREHIAVMIARAFDLEPKREATIFSDVPTNHPYYEAIMQLQQAGIIDGSDGAFNPDAPMTRAQMAKVIVLAFGLTPGGTSNFQDVSKTHWSYDYIAALEAHGIALGDNGKFNPNEPVTRSEFVAFLYRAFNL